jgi:two-component system chemotaxis response regulator CheB
VTKPANVGSVAAAIQSVKDQLIPKIMALCPRQRSTVPAEAVRPASRTTGQRPMGRFPRRCDAVVIGSSTGGPQALTAVLTKLPASFPAPIVVVQHMPPVFTHHLAARLDQMCALKIREAATVQPLHPGEVLIAPGDYHVELRRRGTDVTTVLHQGPPENSCRPAVDVLFRSAAAVFGPNCLAAVLTGMGHDGLRGADEIVQAGGTVLAQDETSSVVWGMPRAVVEAGLAEQVLPLASMSQELMRHAIAARPTVAACRGAL